MFYTAEDVQKILGVGRTTAYKIIRKLNEELTKEGYITVPGKVSKKYFERKIYK